jgi:glycine/serine hydroxymethyltransferase
MAQIGRLIGRLVREGESAVPAVREEVLEICDRFPLYPEL